MILHYTILENWLYTLELTIAVQNIFNLLQKKITQCLTSTTGISPSIYFHVYFKSAILYFLIYLLFK